MNILTKTSIFLTIISFMGSVRAENQPDVYLAITRTMHFSAYVHYLNGEIIKVFVPVDGSSTLDSELKNSCSITLGIEQAKQMRNLFSKINMVSLKGLENKLSADGSGWVLALSNGREITEQYFVRNPGEIYEKRKTEPLLKFGEHIWKVCNMETKLY